MSIITCYVVHSTPTEILVAESLEVIIESTEVTLEQEVKMMNLLAVSLVLTSLIAAQVWSPVPGKNLDKKEDQVIVKEGHRIIVVETYDEDGHHNTKVSISPEQRDDNSENIEPGGKFKSSMVEHAKERTKEASDGVPNIGQAIYGSPEHPLGELICDAFGKCTRKIASVIGKAKDKVCDDAKETAQEVVAEVKQKVGDVNEKAKDRASNKAHGAKEVVEEAYEKAKESAAHKAHDLKESAKGSINKAEDSAALKAHDVKESAKGSLSKAKESAAHKAHDARESAKESLSEAREAAKSAKDLGRTIGRDIALNLTQQIENAKEKISEAAEETKEKTQQAKRHWFHELRHMASTETLDFSMGMTNLMGFATSYGMCVWVTFISSYVLARALPRQQFALVQSKIYPVYFRAMGYCIGFALLGHLIGKRKLLLTGTADMLQAYNLLIAFLMVLFNGLYLEPLATKVMFERLKIQKEEGRGRESQATEAEQRLATDPAGPTTRAGEAPATASERPERDEATSRMVILSGRLKKLNSYSSLLNILTLMSLTCHMVYLGQSLRVIC